MNLQDARRELSELRAAHTWQPEPLESELTATQALTQTTPPTVEVLEQVAGALAGMRDNPTVARTDYGPAIVTHPNGTVLGSCSTADVDYWRASGHTVSDPREGVVGEPRPFTLPTRPTQHFGDVA